jgi:hypothetical protein
VRSVPSLKGSKSASRTPALLAAAALLAASVIAGCGFGPGRSSDGGARIEVTRDFGHKFLGGTATIAKVHEGDTVMRFLDKTHDIKTSYGGGFVESIDGVKGDKPALRDWFYFVNGIEASKGAADFGLSPGDRVQWDYRDWRAAMRVPAIVGAYPEPMRSGTEGKRLPVRVQCEQPGGAPCKDVMKRLNDAGVVASGAALQGQAGDRSIRILVGRWAALRQDRGAAAIERGPRASGVFARFSGGSLQLLDGGGRVKEVAPPGTGLVAATDNESSGIVWVVTGVDDESVARAAQALDERKLRAAYALAETPDASVRLPIGAVATP